MQSNTCHFQKFLLILPVINGPKIASTSHRQSTQFLLFLESSILKRMQSDLDLKSKSPRPVMEMALESEGKPQCST